MKDPTLYRREFLKRCGQIGFGCVCGCAALSLRAEEKKPDSPPKLPPLSERAYCGLICGDWCGLWKATRANDPAAKKKVYDEWKWKEKFDVDFSADQVFCHGCKAPGKPVNIAHQRCTVLQCSVSRGLESCLQCRKLGECDKELWKGYPDFRAKMVKLQQDYLATDGFSLS